MGRKNARTPTMALMTLGDRVRPQQRMNPHIEPLVWKILPPNRGLAGSGGQLRLPHHTTTSAPASRAVRERARPPL